MSRIDLDIRYFRRYPLKAGVLLTSDEDTFKATMVDYCLVGIGVVVDDPEAPLQQGDVISFGVDDLDMFGRGRVAWTKKFAAQLRIGIEKEEALSGRLDIYPLQDIMMSLHRTSKTGALEISEGTVCKTLFVKNGNIIGATSNYEKDNLGEVLLKNRKITKNQLDRATKLMREAGTGYYAIFIDMGYLDSEGLIRARESQIRRIITGMFLMKNAKFEFIEGLLPLEDEHSVNLPIADVIYRQLKKNADTDLLRNYLLDDVVALSPKPLSLFNNLRLSKIDRAIIARVDGKRSIREIVHISSESANPLRIIHALIETRLLRIVEPRPGVAAAPAAGKGANLKIVELFTRAREADPALSDPEGKTECDDAINKAGGEHFTETHQGNDVDAAPEPQPLEEASLSGRTDLERVSFENGKLAFWEQNYDRAARLFAAAIEGDSKVYEYHYMYGVSLARAGNYKKATEALSRANELNPRDADTLAELGHAYLGLGLTARAKDCFNMAIKIDPANKRALKGAEAIPKRASEILSPIYQRVTGIFRRDCFQSIRDREIMRVSQTSLKRKLTTHFRCDTEMAVVLFLVAVAGFVFFFVSNQRAFLNFFYLPVLIGAYFFGKRYATHSALFSIILVSLIAFFYPSTFVFKMEDSFNRWLDIFIWGSFLMVTGYFTGLLYEKKESANRKVRETYRGIVEMMSLIIDSTEKATQNHSYRVSVISGIIAREMSLSERRVEDIRIAALLHDLGKVGLSTEVLKKINGISRYEQEGPAMSADDVLEPVCEKILDVLPLILYYREKFDGTGDLGMFADGIPLGARIIAVADAYDSFLSQGAGRKFGPNDAKRNIVELSGTDFDPRVVKAFLSVFPKLDMGEGMTRMAS